jgi:rhodanese-related sulfurtransferase
LPGAKMTTTVAGGSPTASPSHVDTISLAELLEAMRRRRVTVADVLSPESFAGQHLPGAINLPVHDILQRAAEVLPDRHASIVAYCGGPT